MACCAVHSAAAGFLSVSCAARRMKWRGAQLENSKQNVHNGYLRVAQGIWRGAPARGFEEIK
ncbi:hypothetical protein A2U01_0109455, partial [Trifolium medium]|nr:hypothetical protein [Trifolium medium]